MAKRQHGVVTTAQLEAIGISRSRVSDAESLGRLHRVHQGVYAVGHPALSPHGRCMAAVAAAGEGALLSHLSAAWLWGLGPECGRRIEVTATSPLEHQDGIRVHSAITIADEDRDRRDGVPVTAIPRVLLDVAATAPHLLGWVLERTVRRGLLDFFAIDPFLKRSRGQRGVARLRLALEEHRVPEETKSKVERRFLRVVKAVGLPKPLVNLYVEGYMLDAYWPEERFAVELDTYDYHGDPKSFERDRLCHEDLKLSGIEMVRVTGTRLRTNPRAVATRLHRHLDQRRRELNRG